MANTKRSKLAVNSKKTVNRCEHNPQKINSWMLCWPEYANRLPYGMQDLLKGIASYFTNPHILPTLPHPENHLDADGQLRSNRSEAREAEILVAQTILICTDFSSMQVGTPNPNSSFKFKSFSEISQMCLMGSQLTISTRVNATKLVQGLK